MKRKLRAGILGAGLGSRLKSLAHAKPLALVGKKSLLAHLISGLKVNGVYSIHCALREELLSPESVAALPKEDGLRYLFVNTESSLHTLVELIAEMEAAKGPALFTMADTVLRRADLEAFLKFCTGLGDSECAVLVTTFVDDEKPLWVHLNADQSVQQFSALPAQHITSGMYFLSAQAMEIAEELKNQGVHKMRNFLSTLAERGIPIKTFVVTKTIDVDHPSDLEKAADFLLSD